MQGWFGYREHPIAHYAKEVRDKCIPIAVHGDGAPVQGVGKQWSMSADTWSLTSLIARGPTMLYYLVIAMLWQNALATNSVELFFNELAWSFLWMEAGVWPRTDARGQPWPAGSEDARRAGSPLAGGFRGTLFLLIGDLEYIYKFLKLEHFGSMTPCALCRCCKSVAARAWTNCAVDGPWRTTMWDNYREWHENHPRCSVIFKRLQLGAYTFYPDWMHSKHLGSDQYVYASIIKYLIDQVLERFDDEKAAYNWVMGLIRVKYKDLCLLFHCRPTP